MKFSMSSPLHKRKAPVLKTFWRRFWSTFLHGWMKWLRGP